MDSNDSLELSYEWALSRYKYFPETGDIVHAKSRRGVTSGQKAGNLQKDGYVRIKVKGRKILAHRFVWFIYYGVWPTGQVDHINRVRNDNRILNLRDVDAVTNARNSTINSNNTSGAAGVWRNAANGKWQSVIRWGGVRRHLGYFDNKQMAIAARKYAERTLAVSVARGDDAQDNKG